MRKPKLIIGSILSFMIIIFIIFSNTQLQVVSEFEENVEVLKNKVWKIQLSSKIDPKSVNEQTVYILDEKGEKVKVSLLLNDDQTAIIILPPDEGYRLQTYTLHMTNDIQSTLGRNLHAAQKLKFIVKESLPKAESKSKLNAYLLKRLKEEPVAYGNDKAKEESTKSSEDNSSGSNHSETNVQVAGIDEGDIVKTDGRHIFQVVDRKLQIVKAVPADKMKLEAQLTFNESFYPSELFLYGDQLIVMGNSYEKLAEFSQTKSKQTAPVHETTKAIIYDVRDKQSPKQMREIDIEGSLVASRLMDGKAYLIVNQYPEIGLLKENPELDMRPKYYDSAKGNEMFAAAYDDIQFFPDSDETNFTNIAVIDLNKPYAEIALTTYLGSGNQLYMSKNNLYLAITNNAPLTMEANYSYSPNTTVYKYAVNGMKVEFQSSNEVPGTVLNQFSMDEYKGNFRIATTKGQTWDSQRPSANNLYILDENMKQIGQLEDLARGERIYSARFMNERIYLVTFKETDPLFVLDSENPKEPKVLGELKIPGFSNYLHPYDDNHLIGFGHDTKAIPGKGGGDQPLILTDGVKISLFDVSDLSNPKEKFTEIIGGRGTYSPLNYDHKALLFDKKKNIFAFPISVYENINVKNEVNFDSEFSFQGAYVYSIDLNKGFSLRTKITHQDNKAPYEEWENNIDRVLSIGDSLYALSPKKISSYDLSSYQKQGEVLLTK